MGMPGGPPVAPPDKSDKAASFVLLSIPWPIMPGGGAFFAPGWGFISTTGAPSSSNPFLAPHDGVCVWRDW